MTGSEWFTALPGGLNRYFTDLYGALRARGDIELSASAFGTPPVGGHSWGATGGGTLSRVAAAFTDRSGLSKPGILDRHFCLYGPTAVGRSGSHPVVVHFHGPWAAESRFAGATALRARVKYLLERVRYMGAQRFVVLSNHFRDVLTEDYRIPEDRIDVIPPGVDLARFTPVPRPEALGDRRVVLCVRRLEHRMGIHRLIEAWPTVVASHPDAHLVIVGTGSAENVLRRQAAATGVAHGIEFVGRVDDSALARWYSVAELTVVPTVTLEGFGLIALESLAAGRPAVVTDCGGLPDPVQGLDPTLIVPADDAEALAARLDSGLDGAVPTAQRCRAHAESFSWDVAAQRHHSLYSEVVS
jgi:glycosyltransferase involved in cell wall biosynthesis